MAITLDQAMEALITVFNSYSGKEGDKYKLNKAELKNLLEKELSEVLLDYEDNPDIKKIMADLDENKDGEVDFLEFVTLVAGVTAIYHEFFKIIDSIE